LPTCGVRRCPQSRPRETPIRSAALHASLIADAVAALPRDIAPIDDIRSTRKDRVHVAANLLIEFASSLRDAV
jgi:xanthine dehydrogenase iron-sulfur cluster and FAD-binding subunit A